jgi:hypothetical protein
VAQWTPNERDRARERVGSATAAIAVLAAGVAGAGTILAWHATTQAANAGDGTSTSQLGRVRTEAQQGGDDQAQQGGDWSGVQGGGDLPPGGFSNAQPPVQGSGGGVVRSHGS